MVTVFKLGARWIGVHVGRRGAFLLFLGLLDLVAAYALTITPPFGLPPRLIYQPFVVIAPLVVWAWAWAVTGIAALTAAVWPRARPPVFALAAFLKVAWASGYVIGWLGGYAAYSRGYQTAAIWLAFAGIVLLVSGWRER